ncbi:hypothetical protein HOH87_05040 [bacterium]|jgi:hypothetical protein|nr:hypothetical protein [bacterium]
MSDGAEIAGAAAAASNFQLPPDFNPAQLDTIGTEVEKLCVECLAHNNKGDAFNTDLATQQLDLLLQATPDADLKEKVQSVIDRIQEGSPGHNPAQLVQMAFDTPSPSQSHDSLLI